MPYARECRDDVVRGTWNREPGVGLDQITKDFRSHVTTLFSWMKKANIEGASDPERPRWSQLSVVRPGADPAGGAGDRSAPQGGVSVAGEPAGKVSYPLVPGLAADGIPVTVTCRVLDIARQPCDRWLAHPGADAGLVGAHRANALFGAHRVTTRSSGTGSWLMRPATQMTRSGERARCRKVTSSCS